MKLQIEKQETLLTDSYAACTTIKPALLQTLIPTRALALLMAIGFLDLVSTALLHAQGMIQELNPLMRVFISQSEWLFAIVKGATLVVAWVVLVRHAKVNLPFVRMACVVGSIAYLLVWTVWFLSAN